MPSRARMALDGMTGNLEETGRSLASEVDWGDWTAERRTVLCLDRALFRKDVAEMRKRTKFNFASVSAARVKRYQEPWIPEAFRKQTYFTHYLEHELIWAKANLLRFASSFLNAVALTHKIDAVMAGNTDYWQDDALKLACRRAGIPFVALCRENYVWDRDAMIVRDRFKASHFRYEGTAVAVASDVTRRSMVDSGAFDPVAVFVTGAPRFDPWVDEIVLRPAEERDAITLLSFADPIYLAPDCFRQTLAAFVACARDNQDAPLRFVIKVKKPNEVDPIYDLCPEIRESRIEITATEPLTDLFCRSRVIIGYNSLAVLEGLLSGTQVVVPWWADSIRPSDQCLMHASRPEDSHVAWFAGSPAALSDIIVRAVRSALLAERSRAELFQRFSKQSHLDENRTSSTAVAEVIDWSIDTVAGRYQALAG
jgi:hypothetical protein